MKMALVNIQLSPLKYPALFALRRSRVHLMAFDGT